MKTFKTRIYPTTVQKDYFLRAFGIRRWTWNWAVAEYFAQAKNDVFPSHFTLQKQLNNTLVLDPNYSWLTKVNSMVRQEALKDFNLAIKRYAAARHEAKRTSAKCNTDKYKPHFQKKGHCVESFRYNNKGNPWKYQSEHHFTLTVVSGIKPMSIRTAESVKFLQNAKICTTTILREVDRFYLAVTYEKTNRSTTAKSGTIGIDLGIHIPVVAYDGAKEYIFELPSSLFAAEKKRERACERFSKTTKNSNRHFKARLAVQRAYAKEANIKKDFREKLTHWLTSNFDVIKVDDFTFESALNLQTSNRALYRVGCYAFKTRLKEKAGERGCTITVVKPGTPTTQMCSKCGKLPTVKLTLSDRVYCCEHCGFTASRDGNAARNTYNY